MQIVAMGVRAEDPVAHHPDEHGHYDEPQDHCACEEDQLAPDPGLDEKQAANAV
jgi:hypothetical protein